MTDTFDGNIFFLTADSLNPDYFEESVQNIASLTDGTVFEEAIATAPFTVSAMPGLAAGLYGDTAGIGLPEDNGPKTLAEVLETRGYTNCLISDNSLFGAEYNYQRGFHLGDMGEPTQKKRVAGVLQNSPIPGVYDVSKWLYFNILKRFVGDHETFYRSASALHDDAIGELQRADDGAIFCWIHYMDTHHPYEPPLEYLEEEPLSASRSRADWASHTRKAIKNDGAGLSEQELSDVRHVYRACCEYFADELTSFVRDLLETGRYRPERDMLVFTADHGEKLTRDLSGTLGHNPATFWEDVVRVPLVIAHPDWEGKSVSGQVSLIDLMPTILRQAGCEVPDTVEGTPAANPEDLCRDTAYFAGLEPIGSIESADEVDIIRGVRTSSGAKYFGNRRPDGKDTYVFSTVSDRYDETVEYETADPDEGNVPDRMAELRDSLRNERGEAFATVSMAELESGAVETDEIEEDLRDLGYID